ncbi:alpha/beta hydrolase [Streptomyces sp. Ru62]|uniref:alpha/beta fold hydrolase n=1 Tax=Streptomyces sp. Ru62 TaxID=2080745 RepID=UPI000CDD03EB|nr:alpha/beta hydrolase [Streptomyces sp. Ru62]POX63494.1 alpha/beta hydrolase [Streptomyces sp. Ru62]
MTTATHDNPAILLVHGAWHGSWCWEKLVPELTAQGWRVLTVDLPSTSAEPGNTAGMYDDARAVRACLDGIEGPVTVLAHSYGGLPATEAVATATNVSRLIYLAAFQLDAGDSLAGLSGGQLPSGDTGTLPVPEGPSKRFYGDAAPEDADRAARRLVPQTVRSFSEPLTEPAWKTVPSTYIICEQDEILPPALQETMAARAERSYRLPSSHSPFLSMPAELARLITTDTDR